MIRTEHVQKKYEIHISGKKKEILELKKHAKPDKMKVARWKNISKLLTWRLATFTMFSYKYICKFLGPLVS